jgi:hypothetical protein
MGAPTERKIKIKIKKLSRQPTQPKLSSSNLIWSANTKKSILIAENPKNKFAKSQPIKKQIPNQ